MKHWKRPTASQKKLIKAKGLNYENWLVSKNTTTELVLVHRHTDALKVIKKGEIK